MDVIDLLHAPPVLSPRKDPPPYLLYRRLGGPQILSGNSELENYLFPYKELSPAVQIVSCRYTGRAISAPNSYIHAQIVILLSVVTKSFALIFSH
jgi:hypothetical protein